MGILALIPTIIQVLGGLGSAFAPGSDDKIQKIQKIVSLASHALGGVTYAVTAFEQIRARLGGAPITAQDYDELIAQIDANSATIQQLNQDAIDRDAKA